MGDDLEDRTNVIYKWISYCSDDCNVNLVNHSPTPDLSWYLLRCPSPSYQRHLRTDAPCMTGSDWLTRLFTDIQALWDLAAA